MAPRPAPVVLSPNPSPVTPPVPTLRYRELRVTPTAKGGPGDPASVAAGPGEFTITPTTTIGKLCSSTGPSRRTICFDNTQRPQINTLLIRRAQPYMEGRLPYGVSFLINPDFGGGTTVLQDAYLGLDLSDALRFRFGKFRPPFGLERLQPTVSN